MPEVTCHITKVEKEEDTGWGTISTDDAQVKKITTKLAEKISEAAAFKRDGTLVTITFTEKQRAATDGSGRTYTNRYYEKAVAAAQNGASAAADDDGIDVVPRAAASRKTDPQDAWRMCLNKGGELAVATLPMMPTEQRDFLTQRTIAFAWAEFFFFTEMPEEPSHLSFPEAIAASSHGAYSEPDLPPRGDDIPY